VGTVAFEHAALPRFLDELGDRLVVAVDVRAGRVAVAGWERTLELAPEEAAHRCADAGVARILCTAVGRDGTLGGPDLELLARVRAAFGGPVLAAGGISSEQHLEALADIGIEAAIVGRALLDGRLRLGAGAPVH
jgi:phosphoribosylformimino-5-aminoimidazole carboxamide ribotide isomerase